MQTLRSFLTNEISMLRSSEMISPSNLACDTTEMIQPSMVSGGSASVTLVEKHTRISLVLVGFNFMLFLATQLEHSLICACKTEVDDWALVIISHTIVSSTNLTESTETFRSFTIIKKSKGPSLVPCGTPPLIGLQQE